MRSFIYGIFVLFLVASCSKKDEKPIEDLFTSYVQSNKKIVAFGSLNVKQILTKAEYSTIPKYGQIIGSQIESFKNTVNLDKPVYYALEGPMDRNGVPAAVYMFAEAKNQDSVVGKLKSLGFEMQKEEELQMQQAKEKGEFEKILREQSEKANQKISTLTQQLTRIQVDGTLLSLASTMKAINPEQVVKLVKDQIKMSEAGEVEVIDPKTGQTRYKDSGEAMTSADLLTEFLKANAHFVTAGPAGAGIKSNTSNNGIPQVDINNLDMKNPEHRKIYAQYRKEKGIGY
jgi:hypothetical protein